MSTPAEPVPVDLRDYVEFLADAPAGRRVYATGALAIDLVCLEPHQQLGARTLGTADVVYTVLGGRAWVVTDEAEVTLEPLQAVMIPAGTPHGLRNDSADPLILQAVVSPPDGAPPAFTGPVIQPPANRARARGSLLDRLRRGLGRF